MDMARQKKKPADKLSDTLHIKMTKRDRSAMDIAAKEANLDTSTFVRIRILELIRKPIS